MDEIDTRALLPQSPAERNPVPAIDGAGQVQEPSHQWSDATRLQRSDKPRLAVFMVRRYPRVRVVTLDMIVMKVVKAM